MKFLTKMFKPKKRDKQTPLANMIVSHITEAEHKPTAERKRQR